MQGRLPSGAKAQPVPGSGAYRPGLPGAGNGLCARAHVADRADGNTAACLAVKKSTPLRGHLLCHPKPCRRRPAATPKRSRAPLVHGSAAANGFGRELPQQPAVTNQATVVRNGQSALPGLTPVRCFTAAAAGESGAVPRCESELTKIRSAGNHRHGRGGGWGELLHQTPVLSNASANAMNEHLETPLAAQSSVLPVAANGLTAAATTAAIEMLLATKKGLSAHRIAASSREGLVPITGFTDNLLAGQRAEEIAPRIDAATGPGGGCRDGSG